MCVCVIGNGSKKTNTKKYTYIQKAGLHDQTLLTIILNSTANIIGGRPIQPFNDHKKMNRITIRAPKLMAIYGHDSEVGAEV